MMGLITVSDIGPGLGDQTIDDLQEPFFTTKGSGEGMGLGLAISAEIVKEHGGQLSARNKNDKGAVFIIKIPCAMSDD